MKKNYLLFLFVVVCNYSLSQITSVQDGDWSDPNTWAGGVDPGNNDDVIINHQVTIIQNEICRAVTINSSGELINSGFRLRTKGNWTNNGQYTDDAGRVQFRNNSDKVLVGVTEFNQLQINFNGTLTVQDNIIIKDWVRAQNGVLDVSSSGMTLVATPTKNGRLGRSQSGSIIGSFTVERYVDRCNEWSWYATPFEASLVDLANTSGGNMIYTGFPGSDEPSFSFVNVYQWDEDWSNVGFDGYVIPGNANDIIPRGTGFWYWNSDTVFSSGNNSIPQNWTMSLTGSLDLNTPFDFSLQYTNTGNTSNDGWNFLGNPYPGTLNWDVAGWTSSELDGALYMFNTCGQSYSSYVGGVGTNGGTQLIPSFQGFYVKAVSPGASLQVTPDALRQNYQELKTTNLLENVLRIELDDDEIIVRQNDNADESFNVGMDAQKFLGSASDIYSRVYDEEEIYSINTVDDSEPIIPVYVKKSGLLQFSGVTTWESDYNLTLEDLSDGSLHQIVDGFTYSFVEDDSTTFTNRFLVHFFGPNFAGIPKLDNDGIQVLYDYNDFILTSAYLNKPVTIEFVNMMGQVVSRKRSVITKEGVRMKRPNQVTIIRIIGDNINKSVKVF